MLLALNGYEIGLLATAVVFIVFALIVALVVPRSWPEFPSKWLGIFIGVCIAFFVAQMTAVVLLAEVGEEETHAEPAPGETTPEPPAPTETDTGTTETTGTEPTTTETGTTGETGTTEGGAGDPTAGAEVYASAGCASCHTLADAGSTGTVGPNLDATSPSADKVVERVTNGSGAMPSFKDTLSEQQIRDVAAYVSSVAEG